LLNPKSLRRFQREAKSAARLHHTNIVPVFGVGQDDGLHYYVMQFIPGQSLDQVLAELNRIKESKSSSPTMIEDRPADRPEGPGTAVEVARALLTGVYKPAGGEAERVADPDSDRASSPAALTGADSDPRQPAPATRAGSAILDSAASDIKLHLPGQ